VFCSVEFRKERHRRRRYGEGSSLGVKVNYNIAHIGQRLAEANIRTKRIRVDSIGVNGASAHFDIEEGDKDKNTKFRSSSLSTS